MDSDELYDSLDEDIEQSHQNSSETPTENPQLIRFTKNAQLQEESVGNPKKTKLLCDISSVVPLYDGETLKDYVKKTGQCPAKKSNSKDAAMPGKNFVPKSKTSNETKQRRTNGFVVPFHFREQRTYSNMFHARLGRLNANKKDTTDTARRHWGDETQRTEVSDVSTQFSDAKSSISDTTSFYFDLLQNTSPGSNLTGSKSTPLKKVVLESSQDSDFNFKSVSQFSVNASTMTGTTAHSKKSRSKISILTPILGTLGPDMESIQDKLNLLKKRRNYGQKVSDQNRIKMQEMKVLRDLKYEMKKSRM